MARKRKWTAALRSAVDDSYFIGLPGLVGCQTVFEKAICIYIYMHIYNISYLKRETESICVIGGTVDYVSLFARVQVLCIMICVCMFLSQSI